MFPRVFVFSAANISVKVVDRASGEYSRVQALARNLALNLGVQGAKNKEALVTIHR